MSAQKRTPVATIMKMASIATRHGSRSWYEKLNDGDRKWCDALKEEYKSGKYDHVNGGSLCAAACDELKIKITANTFRLWLRS